MAGASSEATGAAAAADSRVPGSPQVGGNKLSGGGGSSRMGATWGMSGAALIAARRFTRLPYQRLRSDCSTFSALNVEISSRAPGGSPLLCLSSKSAGSALVGFNSTRKGLEDVKSPAKDKIARQRTGGTEATAAPDSVESDTELLAHNSDRSGLSDISENHPFEGEATFQALRKSFLQYRHCVAHEATPEDLGWVHAAAVPKGMSRQVSEKHHGNMSRQMSMMSQQSLSRQVTPNAPSFSRSVTEPLTMQRQAPSKPETPMGMTMSRQVTPKARGHSTLTPGGSPAAIRCRTSSDFMLSPDASARSTPKLFKTFSQIDDLKRTVQGLLNKVCPENVATIVPKIGAIEITETSQLETVIELIFKKALAEPHYCETYADLVFSLKSVFPEFAAPDGGKPITFKSSVLNICQNEFEELLTNLEPTEDEKAQYTGEDLELVRKKRKDRMLANMKFIGHLYLRQLLSAKVIGSVSRELVSCDLADEVPAEHALECACELLLAIGFTLETLPTGQQVIHQVCSRLMELKSMKTDDGKAAYCKRVQFMIQDLLDTRAAGWSKKSFKSSAKTKDEIRLEQERDISARQCGVDTSGGEVVVAGQRPVYLSPAVSA
mmetsp:Transcript_57727/g.150403  ORF Transcript_57727/g.150403 Transcript_57727/m.150403 type:complete len:607 (-) Transcript_57727:374-2194(-)